MLVIKKFQPFWLESSHLFLLKILIFSFYNIYRYYYKKTLFIQILLRVYIFAIIDKPLKEIDLFDTKIFDIGNKILVYQDYLNKFSSLYE